MGYVLAFGVLAVAIYFVVKSYAKNESDEGVPFQRSKRTDDREK